MKTPLGTEIDLGPGHIVLDGVPAPAKRGTAAPLFPARVYCGHGRPSQLLLSSCWDMRADRQTNRQTDSYCYRNTSVTSLIPLCPNADSAAQVCVRIRHRLRCSVYLLRMQLCT